MSHPWVKAEDMGQFDFARLMIDAIQDVLEFIEGEPDMDGPEARRFFGVDPTVFKVMANRLFEENEEEDNKNRITGDSARSILEAFKEAANNKDYAGAFSLPYIIASLFMARLIERAADEAEAEGLVGN